MTQEKNTVQKMVMTAMMMCLIMVMTFIIRVPVPATEGYIHLGDCMIFLGVLLLGWKWGAVAAGVGSALADLLGGYAYYAPITLVVKAVMAIAVGLFIQAALKKGASALKLRVMEVTGMCIGGGLMCAGYYLAESIMYGNWVTPLMSIPMNILQFAVGAAIATILATALYKTPARKVFAYHLDEAR
ncbi:MAG: ECF transporter S component [Eubacteriaceae bacterium]|nr:ECF transporter S component [Eubacteriaceae bacterium]